jgi:signal peptidase I
MQPGYLLRNRYRIEQRLSGGAFGETYIAVDENPDYPIERRVVIKHLKPQNNDPETLKVARELFEKEAKTLANLGETTDRIPTLYAYFEEKAKVGGEEKSEFYLVQELIEGQTLSKELGNRKLSEADTLKIIQNILIGLEKVHNSNNIHRDLKPDNIIRRNSNDKLVLIDFGAVKAVRQGTNPQISQTIGIGTPGYMPGEQWRGSPQFASDIYAVGAIALKCLTGIEPYELLDKDSGEFKWRHFCQVNDRVANILYKMVALRHLDRYANATIAKQEIDRLLIALSNTPPSRSTKQPINQPAPVQPTKPAINNPPPLQPQAAQFKKLLAPQPISFRLKQLSVNIERLDRFVTTKIGLFLFPIALSIFTIVFIPLFVVPSIILSFILIFYRTIRIRGNKIIIFLVSFLIFIISFITIRTYVAEARYVAGENMNPLLSNGTRVIVDKTSYIMMQPKTGDVVTFLEVGLEQMESGISRVIGTPGDRIEVKEGIFWVNGKPLPEAYSHNFIGKTDKPITLDNCQVTQNSSSIKPSLCLYLLKRTFDDQYQLIPAQNIIGKVKAKFWPLDRIGNV